MLKRAAIAVTHYLVATVVGLGDRPYADEAHGSKKAANQKRLHWTKSIFANINLSYTSFQMVMDTAEKEPNSNHLPERIGARRDEKNQEGRRHRSRGIQDRAQTA
jgi:hypothetical protein